MGSNGRNILDLPAEILDLIYQRTLPSLHESFEIALPLPPAPKKPFKPKNTPTTVRQRQLAKKHRTKTSLSPYHIPLDAATLKARKLAAQCRIARDLMLTCRRFYADVAPLLYNKMKPTSKHIPDFLSFTRNTGQANMRLIKDIDLLSTAGATTFQRHQYYEMLASMKGLPVFERIESKFRLDSAQTVQVVGADWFQFAQSLGVNTNVVVMPEVVFV